MVIRWELDDWIGTQVGLYIDISCHHQKEVIHVSCGKFNFFLCLSPLPSHYCHPMATIDPLLMTIQTELTQIFSSSLLLLTNLSAMEHIAKLEATLVCILLI
jgi:hypothetical protein